MTNFFAFNVFGIRARNLLARLCLLTLFLSLFLGGLGMPLKRAAAIEGRVMSLTSDQVATAPKQGWVRKVRTPIPTHLVGFDWQGKSPGVLEVRVLRGRSWSEWFRSESDTDEGPDEGSNEKHDRTSSRPVWVGGGIRDLEVRVVEGSLADLRLHAVRSDTTGASGWSVDAAAAQVPQPPIIPRADWGADESWRTCGPDYADTVKFSVVHHTDTSNAYSPDEAPAVIRSIYYYHTHANGWCDIGYNFLVDRYGRTYEGRYGGIARAVIGAHAGGFNYQSTGVALIGTFISEAPTSAALSALETLLSWKLDLTGVDPNGQVTVVSNGSSRYPQGTVVTLSTISGHRDVSATSCPGDVTYGLLQQIRNEVWRRMARYRWQNLGGDLDSAPDAASTHSGLLQVAAFTDGNGAAIKTWNGSSWTGWNAVGGSSPFGVSSTVDPAIASWGGSRLDLFARGVDRSLQHVWFNGTSWSQPETLGGILEYGPDVASWGAGRLDVFVVGVDHALWHRAWSGASWTSWESLGGYLTSSPTAVSWGTNRLDVFAKGSDSALWHIWWNGGRWMSWESWGGTLASGPDSASSAASIVDVFAQGTDHSICHKGWHDGTWIGWECLGGSFSSDPTAISWGPNRVDVFARGLDGGLWHKWWDGADWWG